MKRKTVLQILNRIDHTMVPFVLVGKIQVI